jgi:hypothetical protein
MQKSALCWPGIAFAAAMTATGPAQAQPTTAAVVTPAALAGTWKGQQCESASYSKISRQRAFVFTDTTWKIVVQVYGDKACTPEAQLLTADFGGDYTLTENSAAVPGAREARFGFGHKLVTPTAAGLDFLTPRCPQYDWKPDVARDIGEAGCADLWGPIASCPVEYDLVAITEGMLHLGDRSHTLCTPETRATKLHAIGFIKQQ